LTFPGKRLSSSTRDNGEWSFLFHRLWVALQR
jgi:hypothetical protein